LKLPLLLRLTRDTVPARASDCAVGTDEQEKSTSVYERGRGRRTSYARPLIVAVRDKDLLALLDVLDGRQKRGVFTAGCLLLAVNDLGVVRNAAMICEPRQVALASRIDALREARGSLVSARRQRDPSCFMVVRTSRGSSGGSSVSSYSSLLTCPALATVMEE
jgi:hypothetical protein